MITDKKKWKNLIIFFVISLYNSWFLKWMNWKWFLKNQIIKLNYYSWSNDNAIFFDLKNLINFFLNLKIFFVWYNSFKLILNIIYMIIVWLIDFSANWRIRAITGRAVRTWFRASGASTVRPDSPERRWAESAWNTRAKTGNVVTTSTSATTDAMVAACPTRTASTPRSAAY